jgi:outer membrane protein
VKARKQAIVSNESALEATKAGYEVGTRNLVNVLDAQRKVYEAKRNYLSTLYDYVLSSLRLKQSAGTLSATDITQLDQWLNKEQLVGIPAKQ